MEGPGAPQWVQVGVEALRLRRPAEARDVLSSLRPEVRGIGGAVHYWTFRADAHHLLGEHEEELRVARSAQEAGPGLAAYRWLEARALGVSGHRGDSGRAIEAYLAEVGSSRMEGIRPVGVALTELASELHHHGDRKGAERVLAFGTDWFESVPLEERDDEWRIRFAWLLVMAGRDDEARAVLTPLARDHPMQDGPAGGMALATHHFLGVLAARRGDVEEARAAAAWLHDQESTPVLQARLLAAEATIHAAVGDTAVALARLREAFDRGHWYSTGEHADLLWEPLRGHPGFEALMRPAG